MKLPSMRSRSCVAGSSRAFASSFKYVGMNGSKERSVVLMVIWTIISGSGWWERSPCLA